jgi:hypothetical protein
MLTMGRVRIRLSKWTSSLQPVSTASTTKTCSTLFDITGEREIPEGVVDEVSTTRVARAKALEEWADNVAAGDLVVADTDSLRAIAELAEHRSDVDAALIEAIRSARRADRSWSEIGAMLGVSKQAAQRKYAKVAV